MKNVIFLCHGAGNGGAERVITTLASEFAKREYNVLMITTNEDNNDYIMNENVRRKRIISSKKLKIIRTIDRIKILRESIIDFKGDIIISFSAIPNIQAIIATIGLKCNLIISERTDPKRYPKSIFGKFLRFCLYPCADTIIFQTEQAKEYFKKSIQNKAKIIMNPIRDGLPISNRDKCEKKIIGIGSLGEQKNWYVTLKAVEPFFKEFPDYILEIYGEGPDKNVLQDLIENSCILRNHVYLKGFSNNINDILKTAAIYVSSSDYEGISNAMLEALAEGIPTICTDCPVGGARMIIKNNYNGILVPVGGYEEIYNALRKIASNEEFSRQLSKNALEIRNKFELSKIVDEWENVVKSYIK